MYRLTVRKIETLDHYAARAACGSKRTEFTSTRDSKSRDFLIKGAAEVLEYTDLTEWDVTIEIHLVGSLLEEAHEEALKIQKDLDAYCKMVYGTSSITYLQMNGVAAWVIQSVKETGYAPVGRNY